MSIGMATSISAVFGERIVARRLELGMTQTALARKVRIQQPDLCDIEKGRHSPTIKTVEKLAKALKVKPSDLLP